MRRLKNFRLVTSLCIAAASFAFTHCALADNFNVFQLATSSGSISNIGLTDSGSLTMFSSSNFLYTTYSANPSASSFSTSFTLPAFAFDNGSSCSVSVAGLSVSGSGKCNNGRDVFQAYSSLTNTLGFYMQAGNTLQLLYNGAVSGIMLDANGDIGFIGLANPSAGDANYLYYDTTSRNAAVTPEPAPLLLLCTGFLGTAIVWKMRAKRANAS